MNPTYDFKSQVALVTGAAMGMGLATARAFARSGAAVVLADRDGALATTEAAKIVEEGGVAIGVPCDVTDEARSIRINAVCPGTIDTPMVQDMLRGQAGAMKEIMKEQSIGRLGRAEEVAAAVLWLCSPGASFVIGVGLPVDGGFTAH